MSYLSIQSESALLTQTRTVKPVLSDHSKVDKMKVSNTGGSLMQV